MGSFLTSCCLTNQSIQDSEEVIIVPLISLFINFNISDKIKSFYFNDSYQNSFKPFPFIFEGTYTDYGLYNVNEETPEYKLFKNWLINSCNTYNEKNKQLEDIVDSISWEEINKLSLYDKLICSNNYFIIKLFVAKKKYYQLLLEESKSYNYWYKSRIKNNFNDIKDILYSSEFNDLRLVSSYFDSEIIYNQYLINLYLTDNKFSLEEKEIIFNNTVNLEAAFRAMSHMNIAVRPTYYVGQDYSNANGIRYQEFMKKVIEESDKEIENSEHFYNSDEDNLESYKLYRKKEYF